MDGVFQTEGHNINGTPVGLHIIKEQIEYTEILFDERTLVASYEALARNAKILDFESAEPLSFFIRRNYLKNDEHATGFSQIFWS
jgi:hypothetical protein